MNALSDQQNAVAMEIGRVVYGGIDEKSPQWHTCVLAASAVIEAGNEQGFPVKAQRQSASVAFDKQRAFNKACPVSTKGILRRSDGATAVTEVSKEAWVFPDPRSGETVMAWFHNVGWAPVDQFSPQDEKATPAQEITHLGQQAKNQGRFDLAEYLYKAAILSDPKYWVAMNEVGIILQHQQRYDESLEFFNRAIEINPQSGELHNNRGMLLRSVGRSDDAVKDCDEALRWLPGNEQIMLNAAGALDEVGRVDECMKIVRAYNERHPDNANARYNLALLLLLGDEFAEGWKAYDSRLLQATANSHYEHFGVPRWRGEPLAGKSVLIWPEQGLGDEIMTASMVGDVIAAGAKVTYLCSERLVDLFHRSFPTAQIDRRASSTSLHCFQRAPLPVEMKPIKTRYETFDYQMSQADLGAHFRSSADAFPAKNSFLKADPARVVEIREAIGKEYGHNLVVGVSWNSNRNIRIGTLKSLSLAQMAPILKTPGVTFINLQYGDVSAEIEAAQRDFGIDIKQIPGFDPLADMDTFAAVVAAMDVVISCSNTTVHVAGGLGIPTWVLTPHGPGKLWYWSRSRDTSLWYPSLSLFRQHAANQWDEPVARAAAKLKEYVG